MPHKCSSIFCAIPKSRKTETGYLVVLPLPLKALSPNARCHWAKKAKAAKQYRSYAAFASRCAMSFTGDAPRWESAVAKISFFWPQQRKRDRDNALASLKAAFDGIADAGIIANDAGLQHEIVTMAVNGERPRVEVVIEPVEQ